MSPILFLLCLGMLFALRSQKEVKTVTSLPISTRPVPERRGIDPSRRSGQLWVVFAYVSLSFCLLFAINYTFEGRAYDQLNSQPSLFDNKSAGENALHRPPKQNGVAIEVPQYHEWYARFSPHRRNFWASIGILYSVGIGFVAFFAEKAKSRKWEGGLLLVFSLAYVLPPSFMHYIYPDMSGIMFTSFAYLTVFFALRGIQRFNPHVDHANPSGEIDSKRSEAILDIYQKYLVLFLAVIGFIAASFISEASTLIQMIYSRDDAFGKQVYNAVHMPYVMSLYSLGTVGCIALGFGVIRELHEKINDLFSLTPINSSEQKTL